MKGFHTETVVKYIGITLFLYHTYGGFLRTLGKYPFLSSSFGFSIIMAVGLFLCTYSRRGKLYFTTYFRVMIIILLITSILKQLHFLHLIPFYQSFNASIYTISLSIIVFVLGAIAGTKKQK